MRNTSLSNQRPTHSFNFTHQDKRVAHGRWGELGEGSLTRQKQRAQDKTDA